MRTPILASIIAITLARMALAQGCVGDIVADGRVDGGDLGTLLANWGPVTSSSVSRSCDLDVDAQVNGADLGLLLANWGSCPLPNWGTVIEVQPDPVVVTDPSLRAAISATGLPWRMRDRSAGIEMLLVPPGTFQMGCVMGSNRFACYGNESPAHQVTLTKAFYVGRYEVTQAQWAALMGSNPSYFQGFVDSPSRPVEQVSWNMAQAFVSLTAGLRLPTEAEWEYACRAGVQEPFYNGSTDDALVGNLAWCASNSGGQTHPVGGKAPNALGIFDTLGNVWEWVNDRYGPFPSTPQTNPAGPDTGDHRVRRGGYWANDTDNLRCSGRNAEPPDVIPNYMGFRVARDP